MAETNVMEAHRPHMLLSADMILAAERMGLVPILLSTFWWNAGVEALWPHPLRPHHADCHAEHDQLVVPEPFELTGEHGLFA